MVKDVKGNSAAQGAELQSVTSEGSSGLGVLIALESTEVSQLDIAKNFESRTSVGVEGASGGPSDLHRGDSNDPNKDVKLSPLSELIKQVEVHHDAFYAVTKKTVIPTIVSNMETQVPIVTQIIHKSTFIPVVVIPDSSSSFSLTPNAYKTLQQGAQSASDDAFQLAMQAGQMRVAFAPGPANQGAASTTTTNTVVPTAPPLGAPLPLEVGNFSVSKTITMSQESTLIAFNILNTNQPGVSFQVLEMQVSNNGSALQAVSIFNGLNFVLLTPDTTGFYDLSSYIDQININYSMSSIPSLYYVTGAGFPPTTFYFTSLVSRSNIVVQSNASVMDPTGPQDTRIPLDIPSALLTGIPSGDHLYSFVLSGIPTGDYIYLQNPGQSSPVGYKILGTTFDLLSHGWTSGSQVFTLANQPGTYNITLTGKVIDSLGNITTPINHVYPMDITPATTAVSLSFNGGNEPGFNYDNFMTVIAGSMLYLGNGDGTENLTTLHILPGNNLPAGLDNWSQIAFKVTAVEQNGVHETLLGTYNSQTGQWDFQIPLHSTVVGLQDLQITGPEHFSGDLGNFYSSISYTHGGQVVSGTLPDPFQITVQPQVDSLHSSSLLTVSSAGSFEGYDQIPQVTTHDVHGAIIDGHLMPLTSESISITPASASQGDHYAVHLSQLPEGVSLYHEEGSVISPVASVNGTWTFNYDDLTHNKIFLLPTESSSLAFDARVSVTAFEDGPNGEHVLGTTDPAPLHMSFDPFHQEIQDQQYNAIGSDETSTHIGAHVFEIADQIPNLVDSDVVQVSGLLPGTAFYEFGEHGSLYNIGTVGTSSMILLTGEQFKNSYFDSPLEFGKVDVGIKVADLSNPAINPTNPFANETSQSYNFTLDLGNNQASSGYHAGDDPTQAHVIALPFHDSIISGGLDMFTYHVNDLGYLELVDMHQHLTMDHDNQANDNHSLMNLDHHDGIFHAISTEAPSHVPSVIDQVGAHLDQFHQHN